MNANDIYHGYLKGILTDQYSVHKSSRAGDTLATSGAMMRFDLSKEFPLINTKKLYHRGIFHELVWFLRGPAKDGEMHIDYLLNNDCNFWTANVFDKYTRENGIKVVRNTPQWDTELEEFTQKLRRDPSFLAHAGKMGRPYGAQWRSWRKADGSSIDQLANVLSDVSKKSDSRRLIVEAWRVDELPDMALPPCHKHFQFVVMNDRLDLQMTQRSCDSFLGVPFNIACYAALGKLAATYAGLKPGLFVHQLVDTHIYCGDAQKGAWYKDNFAQLRERVSAASKPEEYLEIKSWIEQEAPKQNKLPRNDLDHVTGVLEQLSRDTNKYSLPVLDVVVDRSLPANQLLDTLTSDAFKLHGYDGNHYPALTRKMPA